jgi:hypothetical protein
MSLALHPGDVGAPARAGCTSMGCVTCAVRISERNQTRGLIVVNHWPVFDFADQRSPIMTADLERKHEGEHREQVKRRREERELDDALDDSFPASDPPAITQPTPTPEQDDKSKAKKRRSHG